MFWLWTFWDRIFEFFIYSPRSLTSRAAFLLACLSLFDCRGSYFETKHPPKCRGIYLRTFFPEEFLWISVEDESWLNFHVPVELTLWKYWHMPILGNGRHLEQSYTFVVPIPALFRSDFHEIWIIWKVLFCRCAGVYQCVSNVSNVTLRHSGFYVSPSEYNNDSTGDKDWRHRNCVRTKV